MKGNLLSRFVIGAGAALALSAGTAQAVTYTFSATDVFGTGGTIDFVISTPATPTTDTTFSTFDSCTVSVFSSTVCDSVTFDFPTNTFGGTDPFMDFAGSDPLGGGFGAFFFFEDDAFTTDGVYSAIAAPAGTPGFGSAGTATLTVVGAAVVPLPASLPLLLSALGAAVAVRRSRKHA